MALNLEERYGLKLGICKCKLFQRWVTHLGHVVSTDKVEPYPGKTKTLAKWRLNSARKWRQLLTFLGFAVYYHAFVENFAKIAELN